MNIVFLGGTRFIGHHAAAAALAAGHRVTVIHRGSTPAELPFAREVIADRGDPAALSIAIAKTKPDVLVDTRAMTQSDAECTTLALGIVQVPVVVLSSVDVYARFGALNGHPAPDDDTARGAPIDEEAPLTVPYPFGDRPHEGGPLYDKKDVERVLREFSTRQPSLGVTVLRLPVVYGSRDPKRRFGAIVDFIDHGGRALPSQDGATARLSCVHVVDAAHAIVLAATKSAAGYRVFNVSECDTPTMAARAHAIADAMGASVTFKEESTNPLEFLGKFPCDCVVDSRRIRATLGWREVLTDAERARDLVESLRESRRQLN